MLELAWLLTILLVVAGCGTNPALKTARQFVQAGDLEMAHQQLVTALAQDPGDEEVQSELRSVRQTLAARAIRQAEAELEGDSTPNVAKLRSGLGGAG